MRHNFSFELICFTFAQDIIQATKEVDIGPIRGLIIEQDAVKKLYFIRFAEPCSDKQLLYLMEMIKEMIPEFLYDCGTFDLAHGLFHLIEDEEWVKAAVQID